VLTSLPSCFAEQKYLAEVPDQCSWVILLSSVFCSDRWRLPNAETRMCFKINYRIHSPEEHMKSTDGLDLAYAVNFVGPVLLMQMLNPLLRDNAPSTGITSLLHLEPFPLRFLGEYHSLFCACM
jgi:hypothetical protein